MQISISKMYSGLGDTPYPTLETPEPIKELPIRRNSYYPTVLVNKDDGKQENLSALASADEAIQSEDTDFKPSCRFYMIFITLSIATLAAALDATSLSVALPQIATDIHGSAIEAFWAGTSFLLTVTVFQPICASGTNIFGRKAVSELPDDI